VTVPLNLKSFERISLATEVEEVLLKKVLVVVQEQMMLEVVEVVEQMTLEAVEVVEQMMLEAAVVEPEM